MKIGSNIYTVAAGSTSTELRLTTDATADVGGAGVQIGEITTVTYNGTAGNLTSPTTDANHNHSLNANDIVAGGNNTDGNPAANQNVAFVTKVQAGTVTIDKYVRNDTNPVVGATSITFNTKTYYKTGVKGSPSNGATPGDTLEYLIVLSSSSGGGVSNVVLTDALSSYVTLDPNSIQLDQDGNGTFDKQVGAAGETAGQDAGKVGAIRYNAGTNTITVYAGTGGNDLDPKGGSIPKNGKSYVLYQVTIN